MTIYILFMFIYFYYDKACDTNAIDLVDPPSMGTFYMKHVLAEKYKRRNI